MRTCACRHPSASECIAIRYAEDYDASVDDPCQCACHDSEDDDHDGEPDFTSDPDDPTHPGWEP